MLQIRGESERA